MSQRMHGAAKASIQASVSGSRFRKSRGYSSARGCGETKAMRPRGVSTMWRCFSAKPTCSRVAARRHGFWNEVAPITPAAKNRPQRLLIALAAAETKKRLASREELLLQHTLFEIVLGIEQHGQSDLAALAHGDGADIAHLGEIGGGADRPLLGLEHVDMNLGRQGQQRAAPAPWPERADRRQRENAGAQGNDRSMRREVIGGAADGRRD